MLLRRRLHRLGLRYRLHKRDLPGRPDIVFVAARLAVFVDGDFWHGHGWRERGFPSFEAQFTHLREPDKWRSKIERNMKRDADVNLQLVEMGWTVLRVRESEIRKNLDESVARVLSTLDQARQR